MEDKKKYVKGKELILYKKILKLNYIQRQVLIGTLLGGATIVKQKTKSYNIKFEQKIGNKEYVDHLYEIFKDWVGTVPRIRNIKKKGKFKERQSIWFRTYRHNSFLFYYNIFYGGGAKKVPKNIHRLITARSLAYWFMNDGAKKNRYYALNTQAFKLNDQKKLMIYLNKLELDVKIYKDKIYYYIAIKNINKFNELVNPYILDCMKYKLHK